MKPSPPFLAYMLVLATSLLCLPGHSEVTSDSPWNEVQLSFDPSISIADPSRNRVYFIDGDNDRLLTLDTGSGDFISVIQLNGKPDMNSLMCFSLDETLLYVPLTSAQKVQVISLEDLVTMDLLSVDFPPPDRSRPGSMETFMAPLPGNSCDSIQPLDDGRERFL